MRFVEGQLACTHSGATCDYLKHKYTHKHVYNASHLERDLFRCILLHPFYVVFSVYRKKKTTHYRDRGFGGKCPPSVSVISTAQLLCSFSASGLQANGEGPVEHAIFWTATPKNVHLCANDA